MQTQTSQKATCQNHNWECHRHANTMVFVEWGAQIMTHQRNVPQTSQIWCLSQYLLSCHKLFKNDVNANLVQVMLGPTSQYQCKCTLKPTQEEDTEECKQFTDKIQKTLSKAMEVTNSSEEHAEAMRTLLAGSFAQQANNIVGPTLASFLTRNGSHFLFSHETTWCPIENIPEVFFGNNVNASVSFPGGKPFFWHQALNCICHPNELEDANALTFYSEYEVINRMRTNEDELMYFENRTEIKHPSCNHESSSFLQGICCRNDKHPLEFRQCFAFLTPRNLEETSWTMKILHPTNWMKDIACMLQFSFALPECLKTWN